MAHFFAIARLINMFFHFSRPKFLPIFAVLKAANLVRVWLKYLVSMIKKVVLCYQLNELAPRFREFYIMYRFAPVSEVKIGKEFVSH